jgi:hypothetical protein
MPLVVILKGRSPHIHTSTTRALLIWHLPATSKPNGKLAQHVSYAHDQRDNDGDAVDRGQVAERVGGSHISPARQMMKVASAPAPQENPAAQNVPLVAAHSPPRNEQGTCHRSRRRGCHDWNTTTNALGPILVVSNRRELSVDGHISFSTSISCRNICQRCACAFCGVQPYEQESMI